MTGPAADPVVIVIPSPGPDVLRQLVHEMQVADATARAAQETATTARQRVMGTELALRAALGVPDGAVLDLAAGAFRLSAPA